jgi:hypothetical protein
VATLMSNNPQTGSDETSRKPVKGPECKAGKGIEGRRGKGNAFRGEERFYVCGGFINDTDEEDVPEPVCELCVASDAVMCTTYKEWAGKAYT